MPENTVYVGRPTKWGNPYIVEGNAKGAVELYEHYLGILEFQPEEKLDYSELKGKNLACWCPLNKPCHADILLKKANDNTTV